MRDGFPILSSKHQKLLDGHLEEMFRWRELTALRRTELPGVTLDDLAVRVVDVEAALALAEEFELSSLRADIEDLAGRERRAFLGMPVKPAAGRTPVRTRPSAGARGKQSGCLLPPADAGPAGGAVKTLSLFDLAAPKADLTIRECADPAELPEAQGMAVALIWPDGLEGDCCVAVGRKLGAGAAIDQSSDQASASGEGAIEFRWKGEADALASWAARADTLVVADAIQTAGIPLSLFWNRVSAPESKGNGVRFRRGAEPFVSRGMDVMDEAVRDVRIISRDSSVLSYPSGTLSKGKSFGLRGEYTGQGGDNRNRVNAGQEIQGADAAWRTALRTLLL